MKITCQNLIKYKMKKNFVAIALFFVLTVAGNTTNKQIVKWKSKDVSVSLIDNYGTPLAESIRAQNQSEKAYYIYNLVSDLRKKVKLNIYPSGIVSPKTEKHSITSLDINDVETLLDVEFTDSEQYNPVYDSGCLIYLNWRGNQLELVVDDKPVYSDETAFNYFGNKKENLLIRVNGKLNYLDGSEWRPVETLKEYTVSNTFKWLGNSVLAYVERDADGKRFIAMFSIDKSEVDFLPVPPGRFIDIVSTSDKNMIYSLHFNDGYWQISKYLRDEVRWSLIRSSNSRVYLIGIKKKRLLLLDKQGNNIITLDGNNIATVDIQILETYPLGNYEYGQAIESMSPAKSDKKIVLFYNTNIGEKLKNAGFDKIEELDAKPKIWLLPENYKSDINSLPKETGHIYLSIENMKLHYDTFKNNIRKIEVISFKPTFKERNVLIILGVFLLILLLNEIFKKAKVYRK